MRQGEQLKIREEKDVSKFLERGECVMWLFWREEKLSNQANRVGLLVC